MIERPRWLDVAVCVILIVGAACLFFAVQGLQKENERLRKDLQGAYSALTVEMSKCQGVITEHRNEERDRDFKMTSLVQLEASRVRADLKEVCKP